MNVDALQIREHLEGAPLARLYVLCGEEDSLVSMVVSALRSENEAEDMPGSMTLELDAVEDHRDIFDELCTQPFLGMPGNRMVIVRRGEELVESAPEQLSDYAKSPARHSVLVLCCEKLSRRANPGRALSQNGIWVDCSKIKWSDARRWVRQEAARCGKKMDSRAEYALVEAVGPHVSALKREVDKLVLFIGDRKVIDQRAVNDVVPASRSRNVFELSDAIAASRHKDAVVLTEKLLLHGEGPEMIVAFLGMRMRDLWQVARLVRRRTAPRDIAKEVGMPEFAVKRAVHSVRKRDDMWFARRLKILSDADTELKTSSIPSRQIPTWMTGIILELCDTGRSRRR